MQRLYRSAILACVGISCTLTDAPAGPPQESRYFPDAGRGAIHQQVLDLHNPAVVLFVALQPGYEDFPLLTELRLGEGARTAVLYVTNGDATPGDEGGALPVEIAARRKDEAYRASLLLGAIPYFLNIPDPGIVPDTALLSRIWNADTVVSRVEYALRYFKPDAVIIGGDCRGSARRSLRQQLLTRLILRAMHVAADPSARPDTVLPGPWHVTRLLEESEGGKGITPRSYDVRHPVWKKSYRTIAREAVEGYRTLKLQIGSWTQGADRSYTVLAPAGGRLPATLLKGLPVAGPATRSFRAVIDQLAGERARGTGPSMLKSVIRAIDSLDVILGRQRRTLSTRDVRVLASWKNTLETLRCSLLGVHVECSLSDTLLTQSQLTYLRFGKVTSADDSTRTRIFFPGAMSHAWGINESINNQFPFTANSEFRILTPSSLPFTYPLSQFGMTTHVPRARFSFILIHRDKDRGRDYIYRKEIPFHAGPRRTHEVLTPVVRAMDGEPVIVRLVNLSRDAYEGTLSLRDSPLAPVTHEVMLPVKDYVLLDTLRLTLRGGISPGDHPLILSLSGGGELSLVMRSFDVRVDSGAYVGLITVLEDGPVEQALARLRVRWAKIADETELTPFSNVVVDRDALRHIESRRAINEALHAWVKQGGSLVVLPPAVPDDSRWGLPGPEFRRDPMVASTVRVTIDSTDDLFNRPNQLSSADWDQWVISRAACGLRTGFVEGSRIVASSADERHAPLVVTVREGKGKITYVALDLYSQLMNIHPGAHRLLANLLRR
ncbi:MAG: PIG-L family deacetylase [Bacteroidota bacterium]